LQSKTCIRIYPERSRGIFPNSQCLFEFIPSAAEGSFQAHCAYSNFVLQSHPSARLAGGSFVKLSLAILLCITQSSRAQPRDLSKLTVFIRIYPERSRGITERVLRSHPSARIAGGSFVKLPLSILLCITQSSIKSGETLVIFAVLFLG